MAEEFRSLYEQERAFADRDKRRLMETRAQLAIAVEALEEIERHPTHPFSESWKRQRAHDALRRIRDSEHSVEHQQEYHHENRND